MITAKLVTPDMFCSEVSNTGHSTLTGAKKALSEDWPITSLSTDNVVVMADYDGCRLILQRAR